MNIFEDGLESRDFVNVKDVARGVIDSIECEASNGETINLGSGFNTSVIEIAEILKKHYGSTSELKVTGDFRIGDIAHNKADISGASGANVGVGWRPNLQGKIPDQSAPMT